MRRLHARKGMALAMLPALLLAAGGCAKTPVAPVSREAAALTWTIVDEAGGVGRGDFTGKAVTAVLSALDTPPVITYLTGDQSLLVSRMLALDELPDLLTVPAGGALRSKIIGSGRVWNIQELSETLADSLPEDIRCAYQNNSGELFSLPGGYTAQGYRPVATEGLYAQILGSRSGLAEKLQQQGILLAGPTTVTALLNALAMGFRTLAINPDILLLDEAFSALDYQTRLTVTEDVYRILKQEAITTVMVTHDIPESISMGDRILVLTARPARVKEILDIDFGMDHRTPLSCRNNPKFGQYFDHIWKELGMHA